jgi:hypothetical protein
MPIASPVEVACSDIAAVIAQVELAQSERATAIRNPCATR